MWNKKSIRALEGSKEKRDRAQTERKVEAIYLGCQIEKFFGRHLGITDLKKGLEKDWVIYFLIWFVMPIINFFFPFPRLVELMFVSGNTAF